MAKRKVTTKKKQSHNIALGVIAILLALAVAGFIALMAFDVGQNNKAAVSYADRVENTFAEIDDVSTLPSDELEAFINEEFKNDCDGGRSAEVRLMGEYKDYAKVAYGCDETMARMFLKKTDGEWTTISPTNNFYGDLPLCEHVEKHTIPDVLTMEGCFDPKATIEGGEIIYGVVRSPR